jgi:excisionase family DNA binding protein
MRTAKCKTPKDLVPLLCASAAGLQPLAHYPLTPERLAELIQRGPTVAPADAPPAAALVAPGSLLTIRAAAARLGCSRNHVFNLVRKGKLPRVLLGKRSARIPEAALARLVDQLQRGEAASP